MSAILPVEAGSHCSYRPTWSSASVVYCWIRPLLTGRTQGAKFTPTTQAPPPGRTWIIHYLRNSSTAGSRSAW